MPTTVPCSWPAWIRISTGTSWFTCTRIPSNFDSGYRVRLIATVLNSKDPSPLDSLPLLHCVYGCAINPRRGLDNRGLPGSTISIRNTPLPPNVGTRASLRRNVVPISVRSRMMSRESSTMTRQVARPVTGDSTSLHTELPFPVQCGDWYYRQ